MKIKQLLRPLLCIMAFASLSGCSPHKYDVFYNIGSFAYQNPGFSGGYEYYFDLRLVSSNEKESVFAITGLSRNSNPGVTYNLSELEVRVDGGKKVLCPKCEDIKPTATVNNRDGSSKIEEVRFSTPPLDIVTGKDLVENSKKPWAQSIDVIIPIEMKYLRDKTVSHSADHRLSHIINTGQTKHTKFKLTLNTTQTTTPWLRGLYSAY